MAGIRKILDFEGYKAMPLDRTAYANLNKQIKKEISKDEEEESEESDSDDADADADVDVDVDKKLGEEVEGAEELDDRQEEVVGLEVVDEAGEDGGDF